MDVFVVYRKLAIEGDADAATYLASGLKRCSRAFRNDEALAGAMYKLRAEGILAMPDGTTMQMTLTPEQIGREEQSLREDLEYCRGVGAQQLADAEQMREAAAASSGWVAASAWANALGQTPDGNAAWDYLWGRGYRQALTRLSAMSASAHDPVRAYAYLLVNLRLAEAVQTTAPTPADARLVVMLRRASSGWTETLSIQQQAKSEDLAHEILTRNRACCYALSTGGF